MADLSVFERLKSKQDYDRMEQEFQLKKQLAQAELQKVQKMGTGPSDVQSYNYYKKLSPEEQVDFLRVKRAEQVLNLGNQMAVRSPLGGIGETYTVNPKISETPQFQADVEAQKTQAGIQAEDIAKAQMGLGRVQSQAKEASDLIKSIKDAPGFSAVIGKPNILKGQIPYIGAILGSSAADVQAKIDQLKGKNFLQAFESLKGGGAITEREGAAAENAIARMNQSQSEPEFIKALDDLQGVINVGMARMEDKAARQPRTFSSENPVMPIDESMLDSPMGAAPKLPPAAGMTPPEMARPVDKMSIEETIFNAKKAVKAGKSKDAIRQRLIEAGIDPAKAGL